jgi:hypothetical protein
MKQGHCIKDTAGFAGGGDAGGQAGGKARSTEAYTSPRVFSRNSLHQKIGRDGGLMRPRSQSPCSAASFEVSSEPNTGARSSVRLCVGLKIPPCENSVFCSHEFPLLSRHAICSYVRAPKYLIRPGLTVPMRFPRTHGQLAALYYTRRY